MAMKHHAPRAAGGNRQAYPPPVARSGHSLLLNPPCRFPLASSSRSKLIRSSWRFPTACHTRPASTANSRMMDGSLLFGAPRSPFQHPLTPHCSRQRPMQHSHPRWHRVITPVTTIIILIPNDGATPKHPTRVDPPHRLYTQGYITV